MLGLYTASGVLSFVNYGFPNLYITVVVTIGCPDGLQYPGLFDTRPSYSPSLQPNYEFKDTPGVTAILAAILWIMGLLFCYSISKSTNILAIGLTIFGGVLTAISASTMTMGAEESFLDCRNAQQQSYGYTGCNRTNISLPTSPLGYLTT